MTLTVGELFILLVGAFFVLVFIGEVVLKDHSPTCEVDYPVEKPKRKNEDVSGRIEVWYNGHNLSEDVKSWDWYEDENL